MSTPPNRFDVGHHPRNRPLNCDLSPSGTRPAIDTPGDRGPEPAISGLDRGELAVTLDTHSPVIERGGRQ